MPELPELQALAEGLTAVMAGREVVAARAHQPQVLKTADPPLGDLVGRTVTRVWRRGKVILVECGALTVAMHLMQGGRLALVAATGRTPRNVALSVGLAGGEELRLREHGTEHRASAHVVHTPRVGDLRMVAGLGPEPLGLAPEAWRDRLAAPPARLHTALRDGHRVAGIGRAYASDIMWAARLSPFARTDRMDGDAWARVAGAADTILTQATERARAQITVGLPDREERVTAVHGHAGDPCLRCGRTLERVSFSGYELVYCPNCQTDGRVLADRRTSRFLR